MTLFEFLWFKLTKYLFFPKVKNRLWTNERFEYYSFNCKELQFLTVKLKFLPLLLPASGSKHVGRQ